MEHTKWKIRDECRVTYFIELDSNAGCIIVFTTKPEKTKDVADLIVAIPEIKQQRGALLAALEKYGVHQVDCATNSRNGCTCGLYKAIAKAEGD